MRIGLGYDVHRLVRGRRLVLGGVEIAHPFGLAGHSDADVLSHAIADAILGALAIGDLGLHFPDTDPVWRDAVSVDLLARVTNLAGARGFGVGIVGASVTAEKPRLAPFRDAMRTRLAQALGVPAGDVSVKATSGDGVGPEGRGEAISTRAVVLLVARRAGDGTR